LALFSNYEEMRSSIFFFLIYVGCSGQLTRTTTIPHGPLDTLQAQEQVRHRGGDRRAHRGSNPGRERNKSHDWPQQLDPQMQIFYFMESGGAAPFPLIYFDFRLFFMYVRCNNNLIFWSPRQGIKISRFKSTSKNRLAMSWKISFHCFLLLFCFIRWQFL